MTLNVPAYYWDPPQKSNSPSRLFGSLDEFSFTIYIRITLALLSHIHTALVCAECDGPRKVGFFACE